MMGLGILMGLIALVTIVCVLLAIFLPDEEEKNNEKCHGDVANELLKCEEQHESLRDIEEYEKDYDAIAEDDFPEVTIAAPTNFELNWNKWLTEHNISFKEVEAIYYCLHVTYTHRIPYHKKFFLVTKGTKKIYFKAFDMECKKAIEDYNNMVETEAKKIAKL